MSKGNRDGIALLVTLFFILAMMAIVSTSLSLISKNFENSDDESMKLQLMLSGKDLIKILKDSKEINDINTGHERFSFSRIFCAAWEGWSFR